MAQLDPAFKAEWVKRLRSGQYKQGKQILRGKRDNRYCCLGVACDIIDPTLWRTEGLDTGEELSQSAYFFSTDIHYALIPGLLAIPRGLTTHAQGKLASMNDEDKTFAEIADYIEENL